MQPWVSKTNRRQRWVVKAHGVRGLKEQNFAHNRLEEHQRREK